MSTRLGKRQMKQGSQWAEVQTVWVCALIPGVRGVTSTVGVWARRVKVSKKADMPPLVALATGPPPYDCDIVKRKMCTSKVGSS